MRMLNFAKSLAVASLFTVFTFMATGCFGPAKVNLSNNEKSAQGVAIENYLPQDTIMMGSISTQDKNQRENLYRKTVLEAPLLLLLLCKKCRWLFYRDRFPLLVRVR